MGFIQRADLAMRIAVISPAGNCIALQRRLSADVFLERVEPVQRVT